MNCRLKAGMLNRSVLIVWISALLWLSRSGLAATYYVQTTGIDAYNGTSWGLAKKTIQAAINVAQAGDQIWVAQGTYNHNIVLQANIKVYGGFKGTETLLSQRNWKTNVTVIDGGQHGSVVTVPDSAGVFTVIDGFTIQNGNTTTTGGGINSAGSPTIANCTIMNNTASQDGGGIYSPASPAIQNCMITQNTSYDGGGAFIGGYPTVTHSTFSKNTASSGGGGGLWCVSQASVDTCTFDSNSAARQGGGLYISQGTLSNSTISKNNSSNNGGGGIAGTVVTIQNCRVTGNTSASNGGGIATAGATITGCTINENTAGGFGGGLIDTGNGNTGYGGSISDTTISNNSIPSGGSGGGGVYGTNLTLTDVTVTNNSSPLGNGGGLYLYGNCIIGHCIITLNTAGTGGGLMLYSSSSLVCQRTTVQYNTATLDGGGLYLGDASSSNPNDIVDNLISLNSAGHDGGGISLGSYQALANNTIADNAAGATFGGGISIRQNAANVALANNIVAFNSTGILGNGTAQTLSHNCLFGNPGGNYANISPGSSDISVNPIFASRSRYDYHLNAASPCIDTGDDSYVNSGDLDLDGNMRLYGGHVDIGCYEKVAPVLTSLTIAPDILIGGENATGTVTLNGTAPAGGVRISLSSDTPTVVSVPSQVIVAAGKTSVNFTVSTKTAATLLTVTISATYGTGKVSSALYVNQAGVALKSLDISPGSVEGGSVAVGIVALAQKAPSGGVVLALTSGAPNTASVPFSVEVPQGETRASFLITTSTVTAQTTVAVSTSLGTTTLTAKLVVHPVSIASVTLFPSSVTGGDTVIGYVTLAEPAPYAITVSLSSNKLLVATLDEPSITIPAGFQVGTFSVTTKAVSAKTSVVFTARENGSAATTMLTVTP